jgi:hypothetical protein
MNTIVRLLTLAITAHLSLLGALNAQQAAGTPTLSGFVLQDLALPIEEMYLGGPTREGIQPVDKPEFIRAGENDFLTGKDLVVGVVYNGIVKAYPARILNHHEIVNDKFGDTPVAITYAPLSGSAAAYKAESNGRAKSFAASPIVYNNNTLLFDRQTNSLWSQAMGQSVAGEASGAALQQIPAAWTTWDNWKAQYPNTLVMNRNTGHAIDYAVDPYAEYEASRGLRYPLSKVSKAMPLKEKVVGVEVNGKFRAYPMFVLQAENRPLIADTFNGQELLIRFDKESKTALVTNIKGEVFPSKTGYWYTWFAFYPETDVYMLNDSKNQQRPSEVTITTASIQ